MNKVSNRNSWLDLLRAAAITLVVNCHIASVLGDANGSDKILDLMGIGGRGVDPFFVMSGWLLGCILFNEWQANGHVNAKRFVFRRWMRTLPAYYAVLACTVA